MVQLMGILDTLFSERLGLVRHIVAGEETWTAWNGRAVMFTRARARLNEVDFHISSAQLTIKQRQEEIHSLQQSRQQRPSSVRR